MRSKFLKKVYCFLFGSILFAPLAAEKEPILIYNQFPLSWNMDFEKMAEYLPNIAKMGFNVVWVNPFFRPTTNSFIDVDEYKGTPLKVKNSLYEMYDPATLFVVGEEPIAVSSGSPEGNEDKGNIDGKMKAYTNTARKNNITPIFDLVLNHVAPDSPLVYGGFTYFRDRPEPINTEEWFKEESESRWGREFDYKKKSDEIFEHLWKPLITRAIKDFGFDGVRIDVGEAVDQKVLKKCIELIKELKKNAVVTVAFGEALIPAEKDKVKVLNECRGTGFTHLTNLSVFLKEGEIKQGQSYGNRNDGYWWFLEDLHFKRQITKDSNQFWKGTVGFSGSHDHGTTLQRGIFNTITYDEMKEYLKNNIMRIELVEGKESMEIDIPQEVTAEKLLIAKNMAHKQSIKITVLDKEIITLLKKEKPNIIKQGKLESDKFIIEFEGTEKEKSDAVKFVCKFCRKAAFGKLVNTKLEDLNITQKISLAKERIAIAAFASDAGWYFFSGDEILSEITKRPFVREDNTSFGGKPDNLAAVNLTAPIPSFVKSINATFKSLREVDEDIEEQRPCTFWVEMFYLYGQKALVFVRHLSETSKNKIDIVVVNIHSQTGYSIDDIENIKDTLSKYSSFNGTSQKLNISDSDVKFYFVN